MLHWFTFRLFAMDDPVVCMYHSCATCGVPTGNGIHMTLPMAVFGIPFPAQSSGFSVKKK